MPDGHFVTARGLRKSACDLTLVLIFQITEWIVTNSHNSRTLWYYYNPSWRIILRFWNTKCSCPDSWFRPNQIGWRSGDATCFLHFLSIFAIDRRLCDIQETNITSSSAKLTCRSPKSNYRHINCIYPSGCFIHARHPKYGHAEAGQILRFCAHWN
jgi:hypothetical protein